MRKGLFRAHQGFLLFSPCSGIHVPLSIRHDFGIAIRRFWYSDPQSGLNIPNRQIACGEVSPCALNLTPFYPLL
jgi:hypothetical protein